MNVEYKSSLSDIAKMCSGTIVSQKDDCVIGSITSDSRDTGPSALFVPLVGEKFNGHDFIRPLCEQHKIAAFLSMNGDDAAIADTCGIGQIHCKDTLAALGAIASGHRKRIAPYVIGVTGTNGKTTTKELLYSILSQRYKSLKNIKNFNNEIGVPFTLLHLKPGHTHAVIEMGMNHAGEIARLANIACPDLAVITNIGEGHLEFLGSVENVAKAKSEIMAGMKPGSVLFINGETPYLNIVKRTAAQSGVTVKTFGLHDNNDVFLNNYILGERNITLSVGDTQYTAPLYGIHNMFNMLGAVAVARELGMPAKSIQDGLQNSSMADHRSSVIENGYIVIDDTYNSNPLSSRVALQTVKDLYPGRRKIAVLSDMLELGDSAEQMHVEVGREVVTNAFSRLFTWGSLARYYGEGATKQGAERNFFEHFEDKGELARKLRSILEDNDVVLVKGSRSMKMEEVVNSIIDKEE